jgi:type II restriction enzyme
MLLQMPGRLAAAYKSPAQRARVVTEAWAEESLYCSNCSSSSLQRLGANAAAVDFTCPQCDAPYQLKSQSRPFSARITDAAYESMRRAIMADQTPNLFALHYDPAGWHVENLILIPRFVFSLSSLERRKPLRATARRGGWVGCNILLSNIPPDARIPLVASGVPASPASVRRQYDRLRPLAKLSHAMRGWTLDVLNAVRSLGKDEFSLAEVYAAEDTLARLHPENRHVRDKIRQQLQVLRDFGLVEFLGDGQYRLV